jgi:hypothetical protein
MYLVNLREFLLGRYVTLSRTQPLAVWLGRGYLGPMVPLVVWSIAVDKIPPDTNRTVGNL